VGLLRRDACVGTSRMGNLAGRSLYACRASRSAFFLFRMARKKSRRSAPQASASTPGVTGN